MLPYSASTRVLNIGVFPRLLLLSVPYANGAFINRLA
jgi:hypothetical protein